MSHELDLNLLRTFVIVADAASFSVAARRLSLRRSSVSRSVAQLEAQLGVQLFNRTTRHVALSSAGSAFYDKVAPQLGALLSTLGSIPEQEEEPSGEVRLTASTDIGVAFLPEALAGFARRFPKVRIDLRLTNRIVDIVAEGFDAALRVGVGRMPDSSLVARRISPLEIQLFAAPSYLARRRAPRSLEEARNHEWVGFGAARMPKAVSLALKQAQVVADDLTFVHRAVRAGLGIGTLPSFLAEPDVAAGLLTRVLPRFALRIGFLYFVHPPTQHLPRKVCALRDYLSDYATRHPLVGASTSA